MTRFGCFIQLLLCLLCSQCAATTVGPYMVTDLGDLPGGTDESYATGINARGQVVGWSGTDEVTRGFLWSPNTPNGTTGSTVDLGSLPRVANRTRLASTRKGKWWVAQRAVFLTRGISGSDRAEWKLWFDGSSQRRAVYRRLQLSVWNQRVWTGCRQWPNSRGNTGIRLDAQRGKWKHRRVYGNRAARLRFEHYGLRHQFQGAGNRWNHRSGDNVLL